MKRIYDFTSGNDYYEMEIDDKFKTVVVFRKNGKLVKEISFPKLIDDFFGGKK